MRIVKLSSIFSIKCLYMLYIYIMYQSPYNIPYTYKFSRDVNFADDSNLGFSRFYFRGSLVITPCVSSVLRLFYEISRINFVDDKLTAKTVKFTSLENLYVYGS